MTTRRHLLQLHRHGHQLAVAVAVVVAVDQVTEVVSVAVVVPGNARIATLLPPTGSKKTS